MDKYGSWQNIWCDFCQMNTGKLFSKSPRLPTKKVIQLMIHYITNYDNKRPSDNDFEELINVYKLIDSTPDICQEDYKLWKQAVQRAMSGELFIEKTNLSF
jgi:hypothetical protein